MPSLKDASPPDDRTPGNWHPDPLGSANERQWDGQQWTQQVRKPPSGPAAPTPQAQSAPAQSTPAAATTPAAPGDGGAVRVWIRERPIWAVVIAAGIAVILGGVIGAAGSSSDLDEKDTQIASLEAEVDDLETEATDAQDRADEVVAAALEVKSDANAKAAALEAKADKVAKREAKVSEAEQVVEQNSFSDGIWQVGVDFAPGTYRAEGGSSCYWAQLGSADTSDITNNGGFGPNQTLTIDSGWFETTDCGEWTKIG